MVAAPAVAGVAHADDGFDQLVCLGQLPSAAEISQLILAEMEQESLDVRGLATLIERDVALTAALLRLANGPLVAPAVPVTRVVGAVTFLGLRRVRDLLLGLSLWDAFGGWQGKGRRMRQTLWQHAVRVAATATCIAERVCVPRTEAFAAGLLHDIGKAALGHRLGDTYWTLLEECDARGADVPTAELEMLGYGHALVAEYLLTAWHVPCRLVAAAGDHHEWRSFATGEWDLGAVLALADVAVEAAEQERDDSPSMIGDALRVFAPELVAGEADWTRLENRIVEAQRSTLATLAPPVETARVPPARPPSR